MLTLYIFSIYLYILFYIDIYLRFRTYFDIFNFFFLNFFHIYSFLFNFIYNLCTILLNFCLLSFNFLIFLVFINFEIILFKLYCYTHDRITRKWTKKNYIIINLFMFICQLSTILYFNSKKKTAQTEILLFRRASKTTKSTIDNLIQL